MIPKTHVNSSDPIGSVFMVKIEKPSHMSIYVHHIPMTIHCFCLMIPMIFHHISIIILILYDLFLLTSHQNTKKKCVCVCLMIV